MKKFTSILMLCALMLVGTGCRSRTDYGECVGVQESDIKNPNMEYRVSVRNAVLGVIFVETIFAPLIWVLADFECPVGPKHK